MNYLNRVPLILPLVAVLAAAEPYAIHPSQGSRMQLLVTKTGFLKGKQHLFLFERYGGTIQYDPQRPEASQVSLSIESGSAACKDAWLSAKDLGKVQEFALQDMLDVERHPKISFASTAIKQVGSGRFEVQGTLTIRGIAKPAVASVSLTSAAGGALSFEGTHKSGLRITG